MPLSSIARKTEVAPTTLLIYLASPGVKKGKNLMGFIEQDFDEIMVIL